MTSMVNCDGFSCFIISLIALDWSITEGIWSDAMMEKSWTSFLKILFMFSYLLCLSGCKVFGPTHVLINMNQKFCPSKVLMTSPRIHYMHIYQSSIWNSGVFNICWQIRSLYFISSFDENPIFEGTSPSFGDKWGSLSLET